MAPDGIAAYGGGDEGRGDGWGGSRGAPACSDEVGAVMWLSAFSACCRQGMALKASRGTGTIPRVFGHPLDMGELDACEFRPPSGHGREVGGCCFPCGASASQCAAAASQCAASERLIGQSAVGSERLSAVDQCGCRLPS